ncbi:hypothetical protein BDR04DRAFT_1100685 [Suillus decipiens]|nr:hypothetical protein BDR04DRAFT_1100685 [Suillus decipiens]
MAPNRRHTTSQKKAEEDVIREASFTAAIQAIREKKTKNLQTAAAEFKSHTILFVGGHRTSLNLIRKPTKTTNYLLKGRKQQAINRSLSLNPRYHAWIFPTRQVCAPILSHAPFSASTYSPLCAGGWW